jgi:hydroxybutyrate-dimer hydrolase
MRASKLLPYFLLPYLLIFGVNSNAASDHSAPKFLAKKVIKNYYSGKQDDLLTAGWSKQQLAQRKLPQTDQKIDAQWLRKAAYYNNIIALIDTTDAGGYSRLFGPLNSSAISGFEYLSYSTDAKGQFAATLAMQIPDSFNWKTPCIIVAASSGSRGIYGAVGTVGSWALANQCAVAYTDKGTGTGFYFYDSNSGYTLDGLYRSQQQNTLSFADNTTQLTKRFLANQPTAIATKHAHSQNNIEKDSGKYVIQAAKFALYQINQHYQSDNSARHYRLNQENTLIIAASISNGGAASLQAGELDQSELFDGIVVAEPNIYVANNHQVAILENNTKYQKGEHNSYQYFISKNLFGPCALLTEQALSAPFSQHPGINQQQLKNWCTQLKTDGFLSSTEITKLPQEAAQKIFEIAGQRKQTLAPFMQLIELWPALAMTYSNQYGRYSLAENLCTVYFSAIDKKAEPAFLSDNERAQLFATSNGIPPTAGVKLLSSQQFDSYQQAKCFYQTSQHQRVQQGVNEIYTSANLNSIPTIIIHGQEDNLIAPNLSSRTYYANVVANNPKQTIKYYEVTNAQHFDAFTALPMYATEFISLHYYFEKSLELMLAHLTEKKALPPSQLVHTKTRQVKNNQIEPLSKAHLPDISRSTQSKINLIRSSSGDLQLIIPN